MPLMEGQRHGYRAKQEAPAPAIRPWSHPGTCRWSNDVDRRARREARYHRRDARLDRGARKL